jgi:hypothetical protein
MNPASLFKYSNKRIQVFLVDDDGYPIGVKADLTIPDPNAPVPGVEYHAYTVPGYVTATPSAREVDTATDQADGTNYGDIDMGISSYGAVEITLSQRDEIFFNMMRGVSSDTTTSSAMYITTANNTSLTPRLMGMIVTDQVRDEKTGVLYFEHTVWNKGTFTVTQEAEGNQSGGVNPSPLTISFKPQPSERFVATGQLYSAMDLAPEEDRDTHSVIRSSYKLSLTTYVKDGAETTFTTYYKPTVSGATVGGTNVYTSEGTQAALTSLVTTTGIGTMTAAGTSGHRAVTLYATNFVEV